MVHDQLPWQRRKKEREREVTNTHQKANIRSHQEQREHLGEGRQSVMRWWLDHKWWSILLTAERERQSKKEDTSTQRKWAHNEGTTRIMKAKWNIHTRRQKEKKEELNKQHTTSNNMQKSSWQSTAMQTATVADCNYAKQLACNSKRGAKKKIQPTMQKTPTPCRTVNAPVRLELAPDGKQLWKSPTRNSNRGNWETSYHKQRTPPLSPRACPTGRAHRRHRLIKNK